MKKVLFNFYVDIDILNEIKSGMTQPISVSGIVRNALELLKSDGLIDMNKVKIIGNKKKIYITLNLEDYQYLEQLANNTGFKISFLINYALFLYLKYLEGL